MDVSFTYDASEAPLLVFTYPSIATVEEIHRVFLMYCEVATAYKRVAWVIDMRQLNPLTVPASLRKAFADEFDRNRHIIEPATVAEARVVESNLVQGLITAVDWLTNRSYPRRSFTDLEKAKMWGHEQLFKADKR